MFKILIFFQEGNHRDRSLRLQLKPTRKALIKATTEVGHQDRSHLDTRQDAKHWNITEPVKKIFFQWHQHQHPLII